MPNELKPEKERTMCEWNEAEVWAAIHELSDIRANYNLFDEKEQSKYRACSLGIKALRAVIGEEEQR